MIWRLEYENAHGDVARLDIQKGDATPVEIIEGTENPFLLSYELEDKSKKGFIMSSFADISIYETATFNIDDLKTLDETALSVKWYINSVLEWTGFVVPDFFSRTIGEPAIVNLAASDRLSSLEDATLDGLSEYITLRDLAIACLAKTGLSLPLITTVDFKADTTNIMDVFALSERIEDDKGKKISCFDVLRSILVLTNSTIRQRKGQWRIYNKIQHEAVAPTLNFDEVYQGAKRTIQPVLASVGVFQEFGGNRDLPTNNSFKKNDSNWAKGGSPLFVTDFDNRDFSFATETAPAVFGQVTNQNQLINRNVFNSGATSLSGTPYLKSVDIKVPLEATGTARTDNVLMTIEINSKSVHQSIAHFAVVRFYDGVVDAYLANNLDWEPSFSTIDINYIQKSTRGQVFGVEDITTIETNVRAARGKDPSKYKIAVYVLGVTRVGSPTNRMAAIRSVKIIFPESSDFGKGILYRTDQIGNFSKKSDPDTTIFGDFITMGLNGYFYPYRDNDKSALKTVVGSTYSSTTEWTTATDPAAGELPILQHVTRQMSRMFGVAHNVLSAVIDAKTFDPLAIVTNCAGEKYVIVYSVFDFLRSTVEVELQQIAYGSLLRRDFIFSYFGGGDGDGISSIGSVSGGGSSSSGGGGIPQTLDLLVDELFISGGNSVDLGVYARKTWVETEATAFNSARLGGQLASKFTQRDVDEVITGKWRFGDEVRLGRSGGGGETYPVNAFIQTAGTGGTGSGYSGIEFNSGRWTHEGIVALYTSNGAVSTRYNGLVVDSIGRVAINKSTGAIGGNSMPTESLDVSGNGLFTGNLTAVNAALSGTLAVTSASTFGGNVGTSNFASQALGWRVTPTGIADFRHIYTDELQAKAFTADISQALVGSDVLTKSVAKLAQNWATTVNGATSTIYVEELEGFPDFQVFAVGDRLLLRLFDRAGGGLLIKNIWATVASYVSTTNNVQRYTITVNSGGATGQTVYAGSMVLDYGQSGSGVIERTVLDAMGSPYSQVKTWVNDPSNPANYTIHNRTGNLDGIANASGFGFYGENTFLTGKLLVGDLTKAGQYMEYENGQLNIKGKITVTGGNAATKADIDAVQIGGRNLLKNTASGVGWSKTDFDAETRTFTRETTGTSELFVALIEQTRLENNTTYTLSAWIKSNGQVKDVDYFVYNKSISKVHSKQGIAVTTDWQFVAFTFTTDSSTDYSESTVRFDNNGSKTAGVNAILYVKEPQLERGNRATDWTPSPEDVPSALEYLATALVGDTNIAGGLVTTNLLMVKDSNGTVRGGMSGLNDNIGFWTGGTYQGAITDNANVIFRKDGSFSLAGGKISGTSAGALSVDAGVVTGNLESTNWASSGGARGAKFDLNNGQLVIGDAIWMSGDLSEINVINRDTGLNSFKIGDFALTPTDFAGAGVDVLLSSSPVTASPAAGSYQLNRTVYVSGSGALFTSAAVISNSLIAGGIYNFHTYLKVTLSYYQQVTTILGYIMDKGFARKSGGITMQLKNGNTVVWERNISTTPASGVIPLSISTSFQAVSSSLQLIITIDGEYEYREPFGSETRIFNTLASIERSNNASRLVLQALLARMEFSTKGMQAIFSASNYFRCDGNYIEGRGTQTFISPDGRYRLRVSNNGIEKSTNYGEVWTAL